MIPHSAAFDDAVVAGATTTTRLTVLRGGAPVLAEGLFGVGLQVQVDSTAPVARQLSGGVANPDGDLYPHLATDPLAPYGAELFVEVGVEVPGGVEYVPAGVFRLWAAGDGDPRAPIAVKGQDRMSVIANARDEVPWVIAGSTPLADAVTDYARAKYPGIDVVCDPDSRSTLLPVTPTVWLPSGSSDPAQNLVDLAANYGREVRVDATGRLVLRPVPDLASAVPCYQYAPGPANLAQAAAPWHDPTGVHNVVVVAWQGSGVDTLATVTVEVTDPTSPVYPPLFGRKPIFYTSQLFTSTDQMAAYGEALLLAEQGGAVNLPFTAAPHPAHEPSDVVRYASVEGGVDSALLVLSKWTLACDLRTAVTYTTRRLA